MQIARTPLLQSTEYGLYCEHGDFFVDPWRPVERAVITHAHSDHLAWGCSHYLLAKAGFAVARARLARDASVDTLEYGEPLQIGGVRISLHPAGHILGSAQIRLQHMGRVWVVSGDYKLEPDPTCASFEPVPCHVFISECTFGLPIYRWPTPDSVFQQILDWWKDNHANGRASLLYGYSLGKAQRLIAGVAKTAQESQSSLPGSIHTHGAIEPLNECYRSSGVELPPTTRVSQADKSMDWSKALVVAPPSAHGTPWTRQFGPSSSAFASGWMRIRGTRRRRAVDRGFVLSDHVDWPGLMAAIDATGAETIYLTHGYTHAAARWLSERGLDAQTLATRYQGERDEAEPPPAEPPAPMTQTLDQPIPGPDDEGFR